MPQKREETIQKPPLFKRADVWILAVLLAVAVGLWLVLQNRPAGPVALVTVGINDAATTQTIPLESDGIITLEGALPVQLQVQGGAIRFINSVCPDHRCEGFGWLRHEGDWALCAPAQVMVQILDTQ